VLHLLKRSGDLRLSRPGRTITERAKHICTHPDIVVGRYRDQAVPHMPILRLDVAGPERVDCLAPLLGIGIERLFLQAVDSLGQVRSRFGLGLHRRNLLVVEDACLDC